MTAIAVMITVPSITAPEIDRTIPISERAIEDEIPFAFLITRIRILKILPSSNTNLMKASSFCFPKTIVLSMPLPYVMPTAPLFYSITMKTEYEPKKVLLTVDVTALVTKEDGPGRSALLGLSLPLQHLSFCFDYFPIRPQQRPTGSFSFKQKERGLCVLCGDHQQPLCLS